MALVPGAADLLSVATAPGRVRGVFANRTLNLRSIRAIGYDMDYTLVHYHVHEWARRAYEQRPEVLVARGWAVGDLSFDPDLVIRGLIVDTELGNVVKANRFGFVKRAFHGTRLVDFDEQRKTYARVMVDLAEPRWNFLNTLFSLSEACMYMQLVDRLDRHELPGVLGYADLYKAVRTAIDAAHMEGRLKGEIMADPHRFVALDPDTPLALLDQKHSGKKLLLITNSEWTFARSMMHFAFDRYLPPKTTWRDLFDVIIVGASKPDFFSDDRPAFEVVDEEGRLLPSFGKLREGRSYFGGNAGLVEQTLGLSGDEILYVGDHIWGDVAVSKNVLRWRTALILRELEEEIGAADGKVVEEARLAELMLEKERYEQRLCDLRLAVQRARAGYGPEVLARDDTAAQITSLRAELAELDARIAPLAKAASEISNPHWGLLMRAGNDKSHLARQVEKSADIYTSRVSNFLAATPFAFIRAPRGSLPHDPAAHLPPSDAAGRSGRV